MDVLPQRAPGSGGRAALQLDRRRDDLDDAGVEVDGAAVRQVIRGADPMHEWTAQEVARIAEEVLGTGWLTVDEEREFRFEADRCERQRPHVV
jgi:hypothetical protein